MAKRQQQQQKRFEPQKVKRFSDALLIHSVDFPIFYVECISERHFIIAGGGGSSKTGVHNQINILELVPIFHNHFSCADDSCTAEMIMKYTTPDEIPDAIMNGSLMRHLPIVDTRFVTGGDNITIYHINFESDKNSFTVDDYEVLGSELVKSELKCVKSIPDRLLTGGMEGQLTVWNTHNMDYRVERSVEAHSKEIDEIDVDLINQKIVTLSRSEGRCVIWDLNNLKSLAEFKKDFISRTGAKSTHKACKFTYRSCKFAYDKTFKTNKNSECSFLIIACNPTPNNGPSKIIRLSTSDFKDSTSILVSSDGIMATAVSLDGRYLALGTRSGSVSVLEVKNLKQIYKIEGAHHNAVTHLDFLDPKPECLNLTNSKNCALLSVSIDRRIILHRPKESSFTVSLLGMILMVIVIYLISFYLYNNYSS